MARKRKLGGRGRVTNENNYHNLYGKEESLYATDVGSTLHSVLVVEIIL